MNATYTQVVSLSNATADETLGAVFDARNYRTWAAYLIGTGTLEGGVVTIEEAYYDPNVTPGGYTGTWSSLTDLNAADGSGGKQKAYHPTTGAYAFVRARVSTIISGAGGSVTLVFVGVV
jgi:hypothetical protein